MRKKSIKKKVIMNCVLFALILSLSIGGIGFYTYYTHTFDSYKKYITSIINVGSSYINADDMKKCIESNQKSDAFNETQKLFNNLKANTNTTYIYIFIPLNPNESQNLKYIMNANTEEDLKKYGDISLNDLSNPGDFSSDLVSKFANIYKTSNSTEYIPNTTSFGYMLSGVYPIKSSTGETIGLLGVDVSMNEIFSVLYYYIAIVFIGTAILSFLFLWIFISRLNKTLVSPIKALAKSADNFVDQSRSSDDPNQLIFKAVNIHTQDELEELSTSLNNMTTDLKLYMNNLSKVTAEKERVATELNVATKIQADMLPSIFPAFPHIKNFDISAFNLPAKEVGGDFYDLFLVNNHQLCVVMADVSGKGVPAALFMVIAKTLIKDNVLSGKSPAETFEVVNNLLCENNSAGMFVTAFMGIFDINTGSFVYVNGGHNAPALKRKDGSFEFLKSKVNFVLAGMEDSKYKNQEIHLDKDDILFLYTDGVTEAQNKQEELFSDPKLLEVLNDPELLKLNINDKLKFVKQSIDTFANGADQFDDITMMFLEINELNIE